MNKNTDMVLSLDNIVDDSVIITEQLYEYIIKYIKDADKLTGYNGAAKKYYVNAKLRSILSPEIHHRFSPMIDKGIDFLVLLSKHPELLKEINKKVKTIFLPCCQKMKDDDKSIDKPIDI